MKAYITKYALTTGIIIAEGALVQDGKYFQAGPFFVSKKDWFTDKKLAVARFQQMIEKRRQWMEKTVKDLRLLEKRGPRFVDQKGNPA